MLTQHEIEIRVRYKETDAQGHVHHGNYFTWFELGRTDMIRASGKNYEELETAGYFLVVAEISCRYFQPSRFGDTLRLLTTTVASKGARVHHNYKVLRDDVLLAEGNSTIACIDREGRVKRLPAWLNE